MSVPLEAEIELNLEALSVNRAWCGRKFATPEYKSWTEAGLWLLKKQKMRDPPYNIEIDYYMSDRADIDNPTKCVLDLLKKAGVIKDDKYILSLHLKKIVSKIKKIVIRFI